MLSNFVFQYMAIAWITTLHKKECEYQCCLALVHHHPLIYDHTGHASTKGCMIKIGLPSVRPSFHPSVRSHCLKIENPDLHALRQPGHIYHWSCYSFFKTKEQKALLLLLGLCISAIITLGNVNSYMHHSWFLTLWEQFFLAMQSKNLFALLINLSCLSLQLMVRFMWGFRHWL